MKTPPKIMTIVEILFENHKNNEKHRIPYENHGKKKILEFHTRIMKIMKILKLHARFTKIMKINEFL